MKNFVFEDAIPCRLVVHNDVSENYILMVAAGLAETAKQIMWLHIREQPS